MNKKNKTKRNQIPVKYTSREFNSIKADLVEHAKRYYPDTFQDFTEASFGSLMLDTVAYVGDMLSFYLDYQANESFMDTSVEQNNLIRHARRLGYEPYATQAASSGLITLFLTVPANSPGSGPNINYLPVIRRGATFQSDGGAAFVLTEDVDFGAANNEVVVATADDSTGVPQTYAIKAYGQIISGAYFQSLIDVDEYVPYRRIEIFEPNLVEIISVEDAEGRNYYQVDYLSQDTVYLEVSNAAYDASDGDVQHLLKPYSVPRRFILESYGGRVVLQFGAGSEEELGARTITDPSAISLRQYGKTHISDESFDPSRLLKTEKLGMSPSQTQLKIVYRANTSNNVNALTNSVTTITESRFKWKDEASLSMPSKKTIIQSLECTNEVPMVGDVAPLNNREIRFKAQSAFASQNRAVTQQDYVSAIYLMPSKFGRVKRCTVVRDPDSLKRNLNVYVISEAYNQRLIRTNGTIKKNLKTWLAGKKMINDTIDILDARKVNLSITFSIIVEEGSNKYDTIARCEKSLRNYYGVSVPDIGEPFVITTIYKLLNGISGVADTVDVEIGQKSGGRYADIKFNIFERTTADKRQVTMPKDVIWEIFEPASDIKGVVT